MKIDLGHCLLDERLREAGMNRNDLAEALRFKPERIQDFAEDKRLMSLKIAISIADTVGCDVKQLYELKPQD